MNNLISNFEQIVQQALSRGMPLKKRAILREYLQVKFISSIYAFPEATKLSFVGGTSLRLLRNLPRFSEDLDFDNLGLSDQVCFELICKVVAQFQLENIQVELHSNQKKYKNYFELRFSNLLHQLKISTNPKEKLMIKIDYARFWKGQTVQIVLFNEYGFIEQVVTNHPDQLLTQKLAAYVNRSRTQPRDIFDVVWLYAQGARLDYKFAETNKFSNLVKTAKNKLAKEGITLSMRQQLKPFLLNSIDIKKLEMFDEVLTKLEK